MDFISSETRMMRKLSDDLIEIVYYDHAHITTENQRRDFKLFNELARRKRVKKLIIIGRHTKIDVDARKAAAAQNREHKPRIVAEAFVVTSTAMRLAINMYMLFLNKEYPVKVFSNREAAEKWLAEQ
jgi:hypothetical protein